MEGPSYVTLAHSSALLCLIKFCFLKLSVKFQWQWWWQANTVYGCKVKSNGYVMNEGCWDKSLD